MAVMRHMIAMTDDQLEALRADGWMVCDICQGLEHSEDAGDWNGETGCHHQCERNAIVAARYRDLSS